MAEHQSWIVHPMEKWPLLKKGHRKQRPMLGCKPFWQQQTQTGLKDMDTAGRFASHFQFNLELKTGTAIPSSNRLPPWRV